MGIGHLIPTWGLGPSESQDKYEWPLDDYWSSTCFRSATKMWSNLGIFSIFAFWDKILLLFRPQTIILMKPSEKSRTEIILLYQSLQNIYYGKGGVFALLMATR